MYVMCTKYMYDSEWGQIREVESGVLVQCPQYSNVQVFKFR